MERAVQMPDDANIQPELPSETQTSQRTTGKRPSAIRLWPIEPNDADAVFAICKATHDISAMGIFPFSRRRFDEHLRAYFEREGTQAAVVAEVNERIVGMVWVRCGTFTYADDAKIASIVALAVDHEFTSPFMRARVVLKLVSTAKALADQWGALKLSLHAMSGEQAGRADLLFKRRGGVPPSGGPV
jgi:hypothetical protein